jgi:hypothetical protein
VVAPSSAAAGSASAAAGPQRAVVQRRWQCGAHFSGGVLLLRLRGPGSVPGALGSAQLLWNAGQTRGNGSTAAERPLSAPHRVSHQLNWTNAETEV